MQCQKKHMYSVWAVPEGLVDMLGGCDSRSTIKYKRKKTLIPRTKSAKISSYETRTFQRWKPKRYAGCGQLLQSTAPRVNVLKFLTRLRFFYFVFLLRSLRESHFHFLDRKLTSTSPFGKLLRFINFGVVPNFRAIGFYCLCPHHRRDYENALFSISCMAEQCKQFV